MTTELIQTIDAITRYGLQPDLVVNDRVAMLERDLVKIYLLQFDIPEDVFDNTEYPDFDMPLSNLRKNIESNFPDLGFYKTVLDINDMTTMNDIGLGDAIDDLHDIIKDLSQVKWRMENSGINDGLWYLRFIFNTHTKEHILGLLHYIEQTKRG